MCEPADWRVSSYSANQGNCVEVGNTPGAILVRDTKNREAEALRVSADAWRAFLADLSR